MQKSMNFDCGGSKRHNKGSKTLQKRNMKNQHGQPRRPFPAQAENNAAKGIDHLAGLAAGILIDGQVTAQEAAVFVDWVAQVEAESPGWPISAISQRLAGWIVDGVVPEERLGEMKDLLGELCGRRDEILLGGFRSTQLDFDHIEPSELDPSATYCLTGRFATGTRAEIGAKIESLGGQLSGTVVTTVDYLIVGEFSSRDWAFCGYGRKIEKAVGFREKGYGIKIVSEREWLTTFGFHSSRRNIPSSKAPAVADFGYFDAFGWAIPRAFSKALAECSFGRGDILYSGRRYYEEGWREIDSGGVMVEVFYAGGMEGPDRGGKGDGVFYDNWGKPVRGYVTDAGERRPFVATQGNLYMAAWRGDVSLLSGPLPDPPAGMMAARQFVATLDIAPSKRVALWFAVNIASEAGQLKLGEADAEFGEGNRRQINLNALGAKEHEFMPTIDLVEYHLDITENAAKAAVERLWYHPTAARLENRRFSFKPHCSIRAQGE